jgi:hypothetical protein
MQDAAGAVRALLGQEPPEAFGERLGSWVDAAAARGSMAALAGRLRGALTMAAPLLESAPAVSGGLLDRVAALDDEAFLRRLPALREGFEVLSPTARQRFLPVRRPLVRSVRYDVGDLVVGVGLAPGPPTRPSSTPGT